MLKQLQYFVGWFGSLILQHAHSSLQSVLASKKGGTLRGELFARQATTKSSHARKFWTLLHLWLIDVLVRFVHLKDAPALGERQPWLLAGMFEETPVLEAVPVTATVKVRQGASPVPNALIQKGFY